MPTRNAHPQQMHSAPLRSHALTCVLLGALSACGGGGSSRSAEPAPAPPTVNQAPVAAFLASPGSDANSLVVSFDGNSSRDPDGTLSSFAWEFGDNSSAIGATTTHSYEAAGTYTVRLTVTDNESATGTTTNAVTLTAPDVEPPAQSITLSGQIQILASSAVDADVNDVLSVPNQSNNNAGSAQPVPVPVSLGGFANVQGTGPSSGRLFASGDLSDFFSMNAAGGERIALDVGGHPGADLDLRLWDSAANLIDASIGASATESLIVPAGGDYFVEIVAVANASTYVLSIGQSLQSSGTPRANRLTDNFVPGELLLTASPPNLSTGSLTTTGSTAMTTLGMAGDVSLNRLTDPQQAITTLMAELGSAANAEQAQRSVKTAVKSTAESNWPNWQPVLRNDYALRYATLKRIGELQRTSTGIVEPNFLRQPHRVPDDPLYGAHWHYDAISLPLAWDLTTGSNSVVVAVIDTGVLVNHPDFAGQLVDGFDFISSSNRSGDGDGLDSNPNDPGDSALAGTSSFHGTHVAGTVAARTNNASGVAGSGWNTRVMPLRVLGRDGGTSFDILQAVRYAAGLANDSGTLPGQPADIINLSLGGGAFSQSEQDLFNDVRAAGVLVFASAGNESSDAPSYPAAYANVLSVSATTINNTLASYSNFGPDIDLAAPGGNTGTDLNGDGIGDGVMSTLGDDSAGPTTFGFGLLNGTSMSAPHAAGVAALMKAVHPALTPQEFEIALINGDLTQDIGASGRDDQFGFGLLNARRSVLTALALASGTAADPGPILSGTVNRLNFGTFQTSVVLTFDNAGTQTLQITGTTSNQPWLRATPAEVDLNGLGTYTVQVDRTGLANGTYAGRVTVNSNSNAQTIDVLMQVTAIDLVANAGTHFVILVDAAGDSVTQSFVNTPQDGVYNYSLDNVPAGEYRLFAGTDLDNDDLLCDAGEACGAYRTLDSPEVFTVNATRTDLNFVSGFRQNFGAQVAPDSVQNASDQPATGLPAGGLKVNKSQLPPKAASGVAE